MLYKNPVILCDYSDPDVIRVGDVYYMVASSFNFMPGLPILTSTNLVDWKLSNYACERIPFPWYDEPQNAKGIWAPSIRFHGGKFYIFVGMPDEGIFFTEADDPLGKWSELSCVWSGRGFEDPCPIWDTDESGTERLYLVHGYVKSRIGFNSKLGLLELDLESKKALGEDRIIFDGTKTQPTIEGPKFYKRNGFYYIFAPAGGVTEGWQTVLRSSRIDGGYEERIVLSQKNSMTNGPHQGAWVQTPEKNSAGVADWFVHFQERGVFGRIVHLEPMWWTDDGWCVIGNGGEPVGEFEMPFSKVSDPDFSSREWYEFQFSANPKCGYAEVHGGTLCLAFVPDCGRTLWKMPNVLTKKIDSENFDFECSARIGEMKDGCRFGVVFMGDEYKALEVSRKDGRFILSVVESQGAESGDDEREEKRVQAPVVVEEDASTADFKVSFRKTDERSGAVTIHCSLGGGFSVPEFSVEKAHWVGGRFGFYASSSGESASVGSISVEKKNSVLDF